MKVLILSPMADSIVPAIVAAGDVVAQALEDADFIVSYNHHEILKPQVLEMVNYRAINLHVSYLPWNRGAHPNFWSFVDDTPKGVTIHYMDKGIDTGDIIAQREVVFGENETLRTSYEILHKTIQALFEATWPLIRTGDCPRKPQRGAGTYHSKKDLDRFAFLLEQGWDTPVCILESYAAETQMSEAFREKYYQECEDIKKQSIM